MHPKIKSYEDAAKFLNLTGENGKKYCEKSLPGVASSVRLRQGRIEIVYHWTPVVTYFPDGTIMLNSNGYETCTTKRRINEYSPCHVYQQNWEWYAVEKPYDWENLKKVSFKSGMVFDSKGCLLKNEDGTPIIKEIG